MIRSNVEHWKQLQDQDYFERHPCYNGLSDVGGDPVAGIEAFLPLRDDMTVAVIGCGFGRETAHIAPRVRCVYGIDVNQRILSKAVDYLGSRGIRNFIPVPVDHYKAMIPPSVDLVFSITVMQHLTRDLVWDYHETLAERLAPDGAFVVQFMESLLPDRHPHADAELRAYEPAVSWTVADVARMARGCALNIREVRSYPAPPDSLWHVAVMDRQPPRRTVAHQLCGALRTL